MSGQQVNRDLLLRKIVHSKEMTAIEKMYLEQLVKASMHTGRWYILNREYGIVYYCCSGCSHTVIRKYPCCPNCGLRMAGGEVS